jgi:CMP-N-acetylneuraminic acid synthetase
MIKFKNIVGRKPKFFVLDKLESTDIDEKIDFETAQIIYEKTFK